MRFALKLLLVAALTLAFGMLLGWLGRACGPRSVGFAFLIVWLTMCWGSLVSLAFPPRLPAAYYELKPGERDGRRYERLGVLVAKRLLRRGPLHLFNPRLHLPRVRDAPGLATLDAAMRFFSRPELLRLLVQDRVHMSYAPHAVT